MLIPFELFLIDSDSIRDVHGYDSWGWYGIIRYEIAFDSGEERTDFYDDEIYEGRSYWTGKEIDYCPFCGTKL